MYVLKLHDLYLKSYEIDSIGFVEKIGLGKSLEGAKVFSSIDESSIESFKKYGLEVYKVTERGAY